MLDFDSLSLYPNFTDFSAEELKYIKHKQGEYIHSNVYTREDKKMIDILERSLGGGRNFYDVCDILSFMNKKWEENGRLKVDYNINNCFRV